MSSKSASNRAKQKWNANHYAQIKVSVNPEIASEFKAACVASNISMAKVLSEYMQKYIQSPSKVAEKSTAPNLRTRKGRRKQMKIHIEGLEAIKSGEENYREKIPVNLQNSIVYESAEANISLLEEAIEILATVFSLT
jgi:hypothetical protein